MESVDQNLPTTSDLDLKMLAKKAGIKGFRIYMSDALPNRLPSNISGIVNQDDSSGTGTHWVSFYSGPRQKDVVYFDSFGLPPDDRLLAFLKTGGKRVIGFSNQAQKLDSKACGWFCIKFLELMNQGVDPSELI